jgi:hypothetical protein
MIVIGTDTHRKTHTCGAVEALTASARGELTGPARRGSFGKLLHWARKLDPERVWALEDCRHVSGAFERFLIARGERVRVAPKHMAGARRSARERGKSDSIDALSVARAALRLSAAPVLAAVLEAGFGGPTRHPDHDQVGARRRGETLRAELGRCGVEVPRVEAGPVEEGLVDLDYHQHVVLEPGDPLVQGPGSFRSSWYGFDSRRPLLLPKRNLALPLVSLNLRGNRGGNGAAAAHAMIRSSDVGPTSTRRSNVTRSFAPSSRTA